MCSQKSFTNKKPAYLCTHNRKGLLLLFSVFIASLIIQVSYFLLLFIGLAKKNPPTQPASPPVTVLVCAHDEEANLRKLLPKLQVQDYPGFEIIVVDDRSNDGTYDYLRELSAADNRVRVVKVDHLPAHVNAKKYGITLGVKAATHDWILLTDADCLPGSPQWIAAMSRYMDAGAQFVLGYSPYEMQQGLLNFFIRFETLLTAIQYLGFANLGRPYMGVGRNLAYRKSYFLANKGFNSLMNVTGGDDDLYVNRHATAETTRICTGCDALVWSTPKQSVKSYFAQKKRHLFAGKKYRLGHKAMLALFTGSHLLCWLTGVALLVMGVELITVSALLVTRVSGLAVLTHRAAQRFGHSFPVYAVPFLDILFVFYYLSTAPVALIAKRVKWTS